MNIFNPNHDRKAIVIFSGGQDSTTCLFQAIGKNNNNWKIIVFLTALFNKMFIFPSKDHFFKYFYKKYLQGI